MEPIVHSFLMLVFSVAVFDANAQRMQKWSRPMHQAAGQFPGGVPAQAPGQARAEFRDKYFRDEFQQQPARGFQSPAVTSAGVPAEASRFANDAKTAGKSLAIGCTELLKAKDNGKMEWFESTTWYQKAMEMCNSLSGASPMELQHQLEDKAHHVGEAFSALQGASPIDLLKTSCSKLSETPPDHQVRSKRWFTKAENMCATVQTSSPEELRDLMHRQQHRAETASGQLVKQTCMKLHSETGTEDVKKFQNEPLYAAMSKMCAKLGPKKVKFENLEQRCNWLAKMKQAGKADSFKTQMWYGRLEKACAWMGSNRKMHVADPTKEGTTTFV